MPCALRARFPTFHQRMNSGARLLHSRATSPVRLPGPRTSAESDDGPSGDDVRGAQRSTRSIDGTTTTATPRPFRSEMFMHYQTKASVHSIQAQRDASAARKRPAPSPPELERLVLNAASPDNDAWTRLVERFGPRIRSVARYEGLSSRDVEDVVQTTWLELLKYIGSVRDPSKLGAWLYTTARRESRRVAIAGRRAKPVDEEFLVNAQPSADFTGSASPEAGGRLEAEHRSAALTRALETLPERQRKLMHMLMLDPAPSYAAISAELDIPVGSIGPTRARCLERLRADRELATALAA